MKPLPWSHTSLDDFVNCPHSFYRKRVTKEFKEGESEQMIWGRRVHEAFELRQRDGVRLPEELEGHEEFMQSLLERPGTFCTERKIALDKSTRPCGFFDKDVWFRGVIDYTKIEGDIALIYDYKTGKPHSKFKQLKLFALHTFAEHPDINTCQVWYYWTQTRTVTGEIYHRSHTAKLWAEFLPDLKQYVQSFKSDTWQKRPSGLCNGWCPVTDCEFWKPKRRS
jgi:hypothetical protein